MLEKLMSRQAPLIKTCGMWRDEDIDAVNAAKPDMCGFIVNFPASHRNVSAEEAQRLAAGLEASIVPVAVFVDEDVNAVAAMMNAGIIEVAQLHGSEDEAYIEKLRELAPKCGIIKAFKVADEQSVSAACKSSADMILLDSGNGSGQTFDWSLCASADRPFILAGGLNPENIAAAVEQISPWAIDLSSGLEIEKKKSGQRIAQAVQAARSIRREDV